MKAFPKIFAIGQDYINRIFDDPVEITEKVDGSQFAFGMIGGSLLMRSKGKQMWLDAHEKMFSAAVEYVQSIQGSLVDGYIYYCEYLRQPKHNSLTYDGIPKNHLALFGVMSYPGESFISQHAELRSWADRIGINVVPLLYHGKVNSPEMLRELIEQPSYLGGPNMEGCVVKNYHQSFLLGGQPIRLMAGKFVSEKFKEVHKTGWKQENTNKGKWETFKLGFRSEARWEKAVQHLRDNGELQNEPRDIGLLMKHIASDITEEEQETIKEFLWKHFGKEVIRVAQSGFPEWYKNKLMESSFGGE